jgi:hypothetical protein
MHQAQATMAIVTNKRGRVKLIDRNISQMVPATKSGEAG